MPMMDTACSWFLTPGRATEIWSEPCFCTCASLTPSPFTRRLMMLSVWSNSAGVGGWPLVVFAW